MRVFVLAALAAASVAAAAAADITVMSAGAVEEGMLRLSERYRREAGKTVSIQIGTGPELQQLMADGKSADVLIAPSGVMERARQAGRIVAGTETAIARVGVGVAVRRGATPPDISSVESLRQALLRADSVVYNQASTGQYLERLFADMKILDALKAKTTRYGNAQRVLEHVIAGKGKEIGFGPITEIMSYEPKGLVLVGPLPSEVQNYTTYLAAAMTGGRAEEAKAFIKYLTTPAARQTFAATGTEASLGSE